MKAYIIEQTKAEAFKLAKKLFLEGKIQSYGEAKKIISHVSRIDKTPYYKYEIECIE